MANDSTSPKADHGADTQNRLEEDQMSRGESKDVDDMKRVGQTQQLRRNLSGLTVFILTTILSGTWYTWLTVLPYGFLNGGRGGQQWTYIGCWITSICTVLSLAEMASMFPVAGGQYQWVSIFAPERCKVLISYITGWLGVLGWQCFLASAAYATGNLTLILASTTNPSYVPTRWQGSLITLLVAAFGTLFNIFAVKQLAWFERLMFICFFGGLLGIAIPLWVLAPKASSTDVWTSFDSYGGWQPLGLACMIGQISTGGTMIGLDAAVHLAEEVKNAAQVIPRVMVGTIIVGPALGWIIQVTVNYSIQDVVTQVADSTAVYPFISILEAAVGSRGGAVGMTIPIVLLSVASTVNSSAAASREFWSFARNRGFPFSDFLSKVTVIGGIPVPARSIIFLNWFTILTVLLNLGGSEVYDAIIALATGAVCGSYVLSIGSLISWRLTKGGLPVPPRYSLGRAGLVINIIAVMYNAELVVFSYFPLLSPVTASNMNYGAVVFATVIVAAMVHWVLRARTIYRPPVLDMTL